MWELVLIPGIFFIIAFWLNDEQHDIFMNLTGNPFSGIISYQSTSQSFRVIIGFFSGLISQIFLLAGLIYSGWVIRWYYPILILAIAFLVKPLLKSRRNPIKQFFMGSPWVYLSFLWIPSFIIFLIML